MPNRLAGSTSPYLLQHKDNPVDWWEWSDDAFAEARERDIPILLSVGYSACHWCHVMAHESFEDPETAGEMNRLFVNIKVDREERPDVDSIYMEAVQAMTGRGGWPMTVWMTPDRRPFFAGTYFPKDPHHGMASFRQVMAAVSDAWSNNRDQVHRQAKQMVAAVSNSLPEGDLPGPDVLDRAVTTIVGGFDQNFGGFGGAPKFPQQPTLDFLLRSRRSNPAVDQVLATTLHHMADGGIHDQLAGGFARYSVDRQWLVPHFEKMLYDNAQLARIYLWAGIELGEPRFKQVARTTLDYLRNDLRHVEGGFFSAEDADSEGVEGRFYVWEYREFQEVLGEDAADAAHYFGVTEGGNFEDNNILHLNPEVEPPENLSSVVDRLLEYRARRVRPGLDDKVIAAWNGLAIRAFAEAGAVLDEPEYTRAAVQAAIFVLEEMMPDGRLARSWRDGQVSGPGFLDDYASTAVGLYSLYQTTGEFRWFDHAESLVGEFGRFARPNGGFFSTSDDAENLIKRPEDLTDNPLPSGNALAAEALFLSSLLTGDLAKKDRAHAALSAVGALVERYPSMVGHHLAVATSVARHPKELAVVGPERNSMTDVFWSEYRPHIVLAQSSTDQPKVPLLSGRPAPDSGAVAYVCEGLVCNLPTESPDELADQLH